jgi:hypothetical protein
MLFIYKKINLVCILQEAYHLLGKTQTAMDQLLMHVTSAIHNTSWNLVHGHAALAGSCGSLQVRIFCYAALNQLMVRMKKSAIHNTSWNRVHGGHAALAGSCGSLQVRICCYTALNQLMVCTKKSAIHNKSSILCVGLDARPF